MDVDNKRNKNEIGSARAPSEKNAEEARSLSPIEEESEYAPFFREPPTSFAISEPEDSSCDNATRRSSKERQRMLRKLEGDSSSGDERMEPNRQLRRVKGSYCCFKTEAEASGDNDEVEIGLRDKFWRTTVEQLERRLCQAEREIAALKRYRSPQRCQGHERCDVLRRDLLCWQNDQEKRINAQMTSWQLTEQKRIQNEMTNMREVYDTIQQHLEALERQGAKSYLDFRRQIDVWEKRFKEDVISLHDSDLMELRKQLKAWCEVQNAVNLSRVREERCEPRNDPAEVQDQSSRSRESETAIPFGDEAEFLRKVEHVIKFEVQRHRDDLVKRMDQKIAQLYSAFDNFKHNFRLDRGYGRRDHVDPLMMTDDDDVDSIKTGSLSEATTAETAKSDPNADSERKCAPRVRSGQSHSGKHARIRR